MIAIITQEERDSLIGQTFDGVQFFNPIQDINDNWVLSEQEINESTLQWLKDLQLTEYLPKTQTSTL